MSGRTARVEVFGFTRPGDVYTMPASELPAFVARLRERDTDFFEVLDDGSASWIALWISAWCDLWYFCAEENRGRYDYD